MLKVQCESQLEWSELIILELDEASPRNDLELASWVRINESLEKELLVLSVQIDRVNQISSSADTVARLDSAAHETHTILGALWGLGITSKEVYQVSQRFATVSQKLEMKRNEIGDSVESAMDILTGPEMDSRLQETPKETRTVIERIANKRHQAQSRKRPPDGPAANASSLTLADAPAAPRNRIRTNNNQATTRQLMTQV